MKPLTMTYIVLSFVLKITAVRQVLLILIIIVVASLINTELQIF